ncbi:MAG: 50S ribosomal protein L29 [Proteobacteria bacterium]|nr:50S ribosomal protein L29 [Pseudomonadota bacterium]
MNPSEVRDRSNADLVKEVERLRDEVFRLRFRKGAGQLKETANIKKARRDLARVHTVMRERDIEARTKGGA